MDEIAGPDLASVDADTRALVELTAARNEGRPLAIIGVLAHRPELVAPFLSWSAALAEAEALGGRRHELVALRTSRHFGSDYEWGNHVRLARQAGCTEIEIAGLAGPDLDPSAFDETDVALLRFVDAMCDGRRVPAATGAAVIAALGPAAVVEAAWTVGQYAGLSLIAAALDIPQEPGTPAVPPTA